ncbi:MAG: hypothetical protein M1308_14405 [Actinobacteria bacterium]|nr:hypothetical protein [Actinomycetota bacterium]
MTSPLIEYIFNNVNAPWGHRAYQSYTFEEGRTGMVEFLKSYGIWIVLGALFLLVLKSHVYGDGGREQ